MSKVDGKEAGSTGSMGRDSGSAQIVCPFYRAGGGRYLDCEGPFYGANVRLQFPRQEEKKKQQRIFCCDQYRRCEIYRCILENKYPDKRE